MAFPPPSTTTLLRTAPRLRRAHSMHVSSLPQPRFSLFWLRLHLWLLRQHVFFGLSSDAQVSNGLTNLLVQLLLSPLKGPQAGCAVTAVLLKRGLFLLLTAEGQ